MERFTYKDPITGIITPNIPYYTAKEVQIECGIQRQTVLRTAGRNQWPSVKFNNKLYFSQPVMNAFRRKSPKALDRVGCIGIRGLQRDIIENLTDLL